LPIPTELFPVANVVSGGRNSFVVSPDGQRFLIAVQ